MRSRSMLPDIPVLKIESTDVYLLVEIVLQVAPRAHVGSAATATNWRAFHNLIRNFQCDGAAPFAIQLLAHRLWWHAGR